MKRMFLSTLVLGIILTAALVGAVAATDMAQEDTGIPNPCIEAYDEATIQTLHRGYSRGSERGPDEVFSNEAGNCVVRFSDKEHSAPIEVTFRWDGKEHETIPVDPFKEVRELGLIYTYDWIIKADGTYEIVTYDPVRQIWWCGYRIGECHLATYDSFFSAECIAASHDPAYLAQHKAGTGPACVAHVYEKLPGGEVVVVE